MVWPFKTSAFVGRRDRSGATGRRAPRLGVSIESLESRIALSVANDSDPLAGLPVVVSPPVHTHRVQAVVAAPTVSSADAALARSAERITIRGTGFDPRPGRNIVAFDGGVTGKVVSATRRELVVQFTQKPTSAGTLSATVTTNGRSSGAAVGVATVVDAPAVTVDTASLARGAKTLTIRGTGFDPANLTNKVRLSGGATGVVTAATATTLTVAVRNLPAAGTQLKATVTSFGGTRGAAVTVARIVGNPTVQSSADQMAVSSKTITIRGSGFDPRFRNNLVTFNLGAVGYVTSATKNTLVVKFTTPPSVGTLKAVVTSFGGSSNAAQVATVKPATESTLYMLTGETTDGEAGYSQYFYYDYGGGGVGNGWYVNLMSSVDGYLDLINFTTTNEDGTTASWSGTTTSTTGVVTMTATTQNTIAYGYFNFNADTAEGSGLVLSYEVYNSAGTQVASGEKSD